MSRFAFELGNSRGCTPANDGLPALPSETMAALGIVQDTDPRLRRSARAFDLPVEADDAHRVVIELNAAAERVAQAHNFGKGMGIAAPQIAIDRAAAIVRTPDGESITLFNPRIIESGGESDEQYEGCLSFFDVRGQVPRSHTIHVEHTVIDGTTKITVFKHGIARLVAHEIDHLHGHLYTDRMREGIEPIPVEQYRGTGTNWKYSRAGRLIAHSDHLSNGTHRVDGDQAERGANCVEIGQAPGLVGIRDTKNRDGGTLVVGRAAFGAFLTAVKTNRLG